MMREMAAIAIAARSTPIAMRAGKLFGDVVPAKLALTLARLISLLRRFALIV
jgi:hypothetical protein